MLSFDIDDTLEREARRLFDQLGMDFETGISLFLEKSVQEGNVSFLDVNLLAREAALSGQGKVVKNPKVLLDYLVE